jgi:hypothetical protein
VSVDRPAADVADRIGAIPEAAVVTTTVGRYDVAGILVCASDRLEKLVEAVRALPGVRSFEGSTLLRYVMSDYPGVRLAAS